MSSPLLNSDTSDDDFDPEKRVDEVVSGAEASDGGASDVEVSDGEAEAPGPGGLIKTRAQRAQEAAVTRYTFHHQLETNSTAPLDVEAIFAEMHTALVRGVPALEIAPVVRSHEAPAGETVRIERTYEFAGKVVTELKEVAAGSAEAQAYLNSAKLAVAPVAEQPKERPTVTPTGEVLRRPMKRRSLIDLILANPKAVKLSTLEKSRLDWATYVDENEIKGELQKGGGKAGSYLERQAFLARVEGRKYEDVREARNKGRAAAEA